VTDLDEATARLSQYVLDRGDEQVNVDIFGPATDSGKQDQEALVQEQEAQVQGREEAGRDVGGTLYDGIRGARRCGRADVSAATLFGAAQAASHQNVAHFTDTLVRMGYLQDFQNSMYLCNGWTS
jgi:hypothetical protein